MKAEFWLERWEADRIGFHRTSVHPHLQRHWHEVGVADDATVLVPLCGKSLDMAWLRGRGHGVVGIEVSDVALASFVAEQRLEVERRELASAVSREGGGYRLLCGDFFAVDPADAGPVDAFYDRAALNALPAEMRDGYVARLRHLLPPGVPGLLIALEYDQRQMPGPPFAVLEEEVRALCAERFAVERLARHDVLGDYRRFRGHALARLDECVYRLEAL